MNMNHLTRELVRIKALDQMPVDAIVWGEAHDYHTTLHELHSCGAHRSGIVFGLEVVVNKEGDGITIVPGMAIDASGRLLVLKEAKRLTISGERGTRCIFMDYGSAEDKHKVVKVQGQPESYRIIEEPAFRVNEPASKGHSVELARVTRSGPKSQVREAANPLDPVRDELNLLYRVQSHPYCFADGLAYDLHLVAEDSGDTPPNRMGLMNLLREANGQGFHVSYGGLLPSKPQDEALLLYCASGSSFDEPDSDMVDALRSFKNAGGTLFFEVIDQSKEAEQKFRDLVRTLGSKNFTEIGEGHPILSSHFLFPIVPEGSETKPKLWTDSDGIFLSVANYGGGWQGHKLADRPSVRTCIEMGQNILAHAFRRKRQWHIDMWLTK